MSEFDHNATPTTPKTQVDHGLLLASCASPEADKWCGAPIPSCAADITTRWLNTVLKPHLHGARVLGSQATPFSDPGQTADVVEIALFYDRADCPLPERMIAKLAASDAETRELCRLFRHYERETAFYQEFKGDDLPIARCFHAELDMDSYDAVILLEHLAPSCSPSYSISLEQVRLAIREVAKLHARWWNDDFVKHQAALVQLDDMDHWKNGAQGAVAAIDEVRSLVGSQCDGSIATMQIFADRVNEIMAYIRTRPFTLMHCDYHAKQMFFPNVEGEGKFAVIDFQFSVAGPGAFDVVRLFNLGLSTEARRSSEDMIVAEYLAQLKASGVHGYTREDFMIDYKLGALITQLINFIAVNQTDQKLVADECAAHGLDWKEVWLLRGDKMIRELNVPDFLRALS